MIKFTGLILICAASAIALLLPALGVVKFPMVHGTPGLPTTTSTLPPSIPEGLMTGINTPGSSEPGSSAIRNHSDASDSSPSLFGPPWTKQKVGLNVWLLLGPVLLIGLGMWTFAPNRGGAGR